MQYLVLNKWSIVMPEFTNSTCTTVFWTVPSLGDRVPGGDPRPHELLLHLCLPPDLGQDGVVPGDGSGRGRGVAQGDGGRGRRRRGRAPVRRRVLGHLGEVLKEVVAKCKQCNSSCGIEPYCTICSRSSSLGTTCRQSVSPVDLTSWTT